MAANSYEQPVGRALPGWAPRPRPARIGLEGRLIRLEPIEAERHAASLFAAHALAPDDRDWTYLPLDPIKDLPSYERLVEAQSLSADPLHFAVVEKASGRAVGSHALMRIDPSNGVIEIGHVHFAPPLQRTAAGTEAIFLLMSYVFDRLGYRRLEWKCDSLNAPSRRAAERFGFVFEGVFRQAMVTKGRNRDTAWYALVDSDWPAARAGLVAWLDPCNFDLDGKQLKSLNECRQDNVGRNR